MGSLEAPRDTKTVLLTSYRRDGTAVATPVSVAFDGERAFLRSWNKAWKTKRLRNNPRIRMVPSAGLLPVDPKPHTTRRFTSILRARVARASALEVGDRLRVINLHLPVPRRRAGLPRSLPPRPSKSPRGRLAVARR